jgi:PAN domain-containing protein
MTSISAVLLSFLLCAISTATFAQSPTDIASRVENFVDRIIIKSARSRWSKLSEPEYACVDNKLQQRGDSIQALIKKGVSPGNKRIAEIRAECRSLAISQQFKRLHNRAYKRSGQDTIISVSNYRECEAACNESASCTALTFFREEKFCRIMPKPTQLEDDEGADSAYRTDAMTGSVVPKT